MDLSEALLYPVEFLNSLESTGIPTHNLQLKVGVPIMLLRNLDPPSCATALDSVRIIYILT
jgi:ATP-dependent DNA helicase PIF1